MSCTKLKLLNTVNFKRTSFIFAASMKNSFLFLFLLLPIAVISQEKYTKAIHLITDNDLYVSTKKDRYYTNGFFLSYQYASKKTFKNLEKKIFELSIGHEMYSPFKAIVEDVSLHDRPFAAHLFGSFGMHYVYKNNQTLKMAVQLGVIGPAAIGRELQDFIHDIYGFRRAIGWDYQIKSALSLNVEGNYTRFLVKDASNYYDISFLGKARIGTVYTDISAGFFSRIGFSPLQKLVNSIAFNTAINNNNSSFKRERESFLYLKPSIHYRVYDATLQGSFLNTSSLITKTLIPIKFEMEIGLQFAVKRFNFKYAANYQTNKSEGLRYRNGNFYGTLAISYLLH